MRYLLRSTACKIWLCRAAAVFLALFACALCPGPAATPRVLSSVPLWEPAAVEKAREDLPARGEQRYVEVTMLVTAYTAGPESTGKKPGHPLYGITASGAKVFPGVVAADPAIPFGTRVWVPGYGHGVVLDRGAVVRGLHIDVYIPNLREAREWGVRYLPVRLYGVGPEILRALGAAESP